MDMVKRYCSAGPIPQDRLIDVCESLHEQGWNPEQVILLGQAQMQKTLSIRPEQQVVLVFMVMGAKMCIRGEKPEMPKITLGGAA